jgi:DNA-binding protein H-NS
MQLKSMSVDRLVDLREKVDIALKTKVADARSDLEARLKKLPGSGSKRDRRRGSRGPVAPKYKNPDNPSETWSGRGLQPRWLTSELKRGGRLEDFLIGAPPRKSRRAVMKSRKAKVVRKQARPRKATKARKAPAPSKQASSRPASRPPGKRGRPTAPTPAQPIQRPPEAPTPGASTPETTPA